MTCTCITPADLSPHMAKIEAIPTIEPLKFICLKAKAQLQYYQKYLSSQFSLIGRNLLDSTPHYLWFLFDKSASVPHSDLKPYKTFIWSIKVHSF